MQKTTIRFTTKLPPPGESKKSGSLLALPKSASLTTKNAIEAEGTIDGFPFRAALETDPYGNQALRISKNLQAAASANDGETVTIEITRLDNEPEVWPPSDLLTALKEHPTAKTTWDQITPLARRDWILWISSAKRAPTREARIKKACSMLATGKRRVCCFGGLNWLTKDHPTVKTWSSLPQ